MSFAYLRLGISFIRSTASKVRKSKSKVEGAVSHEGNRKTEKMGSRKHNSIFVSRSDTDAFLISGTIASVRNAHARVMTACAMEQGLYSLFAGYDRTLLGQYELFFYNGGDKSGVWKPETMSRKVAETAGEVLSPLHRGWEFYQAVYLADRLQKFISAAIVLRQTRREVLSPVRSVRQ